MSYPVNLNVTGKKCLVVGGGRVGARKARGLVVEGAIVTVLSSSFYEQIDDVTYIKARYHKSYMDQIQPWLVVTCTPSREANTQAQIDANTIGAIVMRADDSKAGDAHGIMKRDHGTMTITASSGVPTLSRYLLDQFEETLTPEVVEVAAELQTIRKELRERLATSDVRTAIWNQITPRYNDWLAASRAGKPIDVRAEVEILIQSHLNSD
jgi:precorrin-2 dehydrogenase/sirohydrochlorin ferrochelatase